MKHIKIRGELTEDLLGVRIYVEEQTHVGDAFGIDGNFTFKSRPIELSSFNSLADYDWANVEDETYFTRDLKGLSQVFVRGISYEIDTPDGRVLSLLDWEQLKAAVVEYNLYFSGEDD